MYLQEDSPKAAEMRKKVRNMLLSDEESNLQLALQLIESGGAHKDFIEPLWVQFIRFHFEYYDKEIKETVKKILFSVLSDSQRKVFEVKTKFSRNQTKAAFWDKLLPALNRNVATNGLIYEFAVCGLILLKAGGKFCLENNIVPKKVIFRLMIQGNGLLDLRNFNLQEVPAEIADLPIKELNFLDNPLEREPSFLWTNTQLKRVWFYPGTHPRLIRRYAKCFPNAVDKSYYSMGVSLSNEGIELQRHDEMKEATEKSNHSLHFLRRVSKKSRDKDYYHFRALTSNTVGRYQIAKICYEHIINSGEKYGDCLYNMACNQSRMGNKFKTLEYIEAHFQYSILDFSYQIYERDYFLEDNDFENYWNDVDFILLLDRFVPVVNEQT